MRAKAARSAIEGMALASLLVACGPAVPSGAPMRLALEQWTRLPGSVRFLGDSDELDLRSRRTLEDAVRIMQERTDVRRLRVSGRAEAQPVAEARARHVADILVGMGVPRGAIEIMGHAGPGERRVELRVLLARQR
jgi:outer membrane protein OmpA-like peptidoglycan-associated protein